MMSGNGKICQHSANDVWKWQDLSTHSANEVWKGKMHQHTLQMVSGNSKADQHSANLHPLKSESMDNRPPKN